MMVSTAVGSVARHIETVNNAAPHPHPPDASMSIGVSRESDRHNGANVKGHRCYQIPNGGGGATFEMQDVVKVNTRSLHVSKWRANRVPPTCFIQVGGPLCTFTTIFCSMR